MSFTLLTNKHVTGRKQYRCSWCDELIEKGEKHLYYTSVYYGDFQTTRMHLECEAAMDKTDRDELIDGWEPGSYKRGDSVPI